MDLSIVINQDPHHILARHGAGKHDPVALVTNLGARAERQYVVTELDGAAARETHHNALGRRRNRPRDGSQPMLEENGA